MWWLIDRWVENVSVTHIVVDWQTCEEHGDWLTGEWRTWWLIDRHWLLVVKNVVVDWQVSRECVSDARSCWLTDVWRTWWLIDRRVKNMVVDWHDWQTCEERGGWLTGEWRTWWFRRPLRVYWSCTRCCWWSWWSPINTTTASRTSWDLLITRRLIDRSTTSRWRLGSGRAPAPPRRLMFNLILS